jgi:hypothetical protein
MDPEKVIYALKLMGVFKLKCPCPSNCSTSLEIATLLVPIASLFRAAMFCHVEAGLESDAFLISLKGMLLNLEPPLPIQS